jgi:hypothetical protein
MTHWTKQHAGFYTLDGTDYAVASMQANSANPDNSGDFVGGVEWAAVRFTGPERGAQDGENLDWFDTMREARAEAERLAARQPSDGHLR